MATIPEIRASYEAEKSNLILQCFDLRANALRREPIVPSATLAQLPRHESASVQAAGAEEWAVQERNRLQARYVELDLQEQAALDVRLEEIDRLLCPQNVTAEELLTASQASPAALVAAMDLALDSGLEDQALLMFAAGRQRDLDEVIDHAITVRSDWAELYGELLTVNSYPRFDVDELRQRFDGMATPAPTRGELKQEILTGAQSALNTYSQMR